MEPRDSKFTPCWIMNWSTFHHTESEHKSLSRADSMSVWEQFPCLLWWWLQFCSLREHFGVFWPDLQSHFDILVVVRYVWTSELLLNPHMHKYFSVPKPFFTIFRAATFFLVLQQHFTQAVNLVVSDSNLIIFSCPECIRGPKSGDCLILYHNVISPTAHVVHGANCSILLIQEIFLLARISWTFVHPLISECHYSSKILKEILNLSMAFNVNNLGLQCYHMGTDMYKNPINIFEHKVTWVQILWLCNECAIQLASHCRTR